MEENTGDGEVSTSRPGTGMNPSSRPVTGKAGVTSSRPGTAAKSRPATGAASRPATGVGSRPATSKSRPATGLRSRPGTGGSKIGSRPSSVKSIKVWKESETDGSPRSEEFGSDDEDMLLTRDDVEKGCWHSFSQCVGGMWSTREITTSADKEIFVRTTIRELVLYVMFLVVLSIVTFMMTSPTHFYYTKVMKDIFNQQPEVKNVGEFWEFMEEQFLDGIHWEYWYHDGDARHYICPGGEEATGPCPVAPSDRNILYENRLLGLPRLRQLRVTNQSCEIHRDFQNAIKNCWAPYSQSIEDKSDFIPTFREKTSKTAWTYQTAEEMGSLGSGEISGKVGKYSGHGSVQNLHSVKNESAAIIHELKETLWISRSTRAVIIDFTVYNANINLFCVVNFLFEFPATGGIISGYSYKTVKLLRYVGYLDYFIMACEFIYIMFIIYYIIEETLEIITVGLPYFQGVWNVLDIVVVLLSVINQTLNIYTYLTMESQLNNLLGDPDTFADFQTLGSYSEAFKSFVAICVFFSWVKLFKYISFNKTMTQLASTLTRCAGDIMGFSIMFSIVFFAFAQLGYLLFGTQVDDFSTFDSAIFTLLRTILGDFDFNSIEQANRILGPIFFLCYVFFVFFVLLNMFLAIINDTYSEVKAEIAAQKNEFELGDYLKRGYNNMLGKVGMRSKLIDIENALALADADGEITYEEVRQNLKKCNFSDMEIEMFFAKYDLDGDGILDMDEGTNVVLDLDSDHIDRDRKNPDKMNAVNGNVSHEELGMLNSRVDRMEGVIDNIVDKIDSVLNKLEVMEKSKNKRKANMGKILDGFTMNPEMDEESKRRQVEEMFTTWDSESRPTTSGDPI